MPWPWIFLAVTLVGAWFTFNAYLPTRARGPLIVPSFFAGWLTSELSAHHFAWQLVATVFFVWVGALEAWPGPRPPLFFGALEELSDPAPPGTRRRKLLI